LGDHVFRLKDEERRVEDRRLMAAGRQTENKNRRLKTDGQVNRQKAVRNKEAFPFSLQPSTFSLLF